MTGLTPLNVLVFKDCPFCGKTVGKSFDATSYHRYLAGEKVQDCFPDRSADDRVFLITGICPDCWEKTFKEES